MISAAVLAGGRSARMGRDKALISVRGRTLVEHVVDRLRPVSDDVFVVTKDAKALDHLDVPVVTDRRDAQTPLAGIATALRAARHSRVFVCACDMPFVSAELVHVLAERLDSHLAVAPVDQPMHTVWASSAASEIELSLAAGERAVHRVLERIDTLWITEPQWRTVDPRGASFTNVNTPEDLATL